MENQNVLNGNKIIAEFMDCSVSKPIFEATQFLDHNGQSLLIGYASLNNLDYHKSWDWLIPVIQKIDKIIGDDEFNKEKEFTYYNIFEYANEITLLYKEVIKFIKWYNENKKE